MFVKEVKGQNRQAIVGKMHEDGYPEATGPDKHITQQSANEHTRDKTIELHMDRRKDDSCHPNSDVLIAQDLLQSTAEGEFFRYSR